MLPDMNEKKGKLSLQISSKGTSYAGSQVLPFWQGVSVGKEFKKKLGTAFLFEFCVPSCLGKKQMDVKSPFPASPICATLTCSGSERFKPSEKSMFIRHKFLCEFFAKRGTTCAGKETSFRSIHWVRRYPEEHVSKSLIPLSSYSQRYNQPTYRVESCMCM